MEMEDYFYHLDECERFLETFRNSHSELYEKFHGLLDIDTRSSGRVTIKEDIAIRPATRLFLNHVLKEFYDPLDN